MIGGTTKVYVPDSNNFALGLNAEAKTQNAFMNDLILNSSYGGF